MLTDKVIKLLKNNDVNLNEESVVFAFSDGTIAVSFDEENRSIKIEVDFVDRVISVVDVSIEDLIDDEGEL
jgi:hypothetical protein